MRLSGAVSYHEISIDGCTVRAFADVPLSEHNKCEKCRDPECETVIQFIERSGPTDVFVEVAFVDKLSRSNPSVALRKGLSRVSFDDRVIFNALNLVRLLSGLPQMRAGLIGKVFKKYGDRFFQNQADDGLPRFHYTDIRFEPIVYNAMMRLSTYYRGSTMRLTSEGRDFLRSTVASPNDFLAFFAGFVGPTLSLKRLGLPDNLAVFLTPDGRHRISKSLSRCPEPFATTIREFFDSHLRALSIQYGALMESPGVDSGTVTFDQDVHEVWMSAFHLLVITYTTARLLRYAKNSSVDRNVVLVATENTVNGMMDILSELSIKSNVSVVGVRDGRSGDIQDGDVATSLLLQLSPGEVSRRSAHAAKRSRCLFVPITKSPK